MRKRNNIVFMHKALTVRKSINKKMNYDKCSSNILSIIYRVNRCNIANKQKHYSSKQILKRRNSRRKLNFHYLATLYKQFNLKK